MEKENSLKKYAPRKPRKVSCLYCGKEYITKTKGGCCSDKCKKERIKQQERKRNKRYGKKYFADSTKKYAKKNRKKINAKASANYHIKIPKGQVCQFKDCWKLAKVKHHEDYDKPLVVKFYCVEHHGFVHRKLK